jgi:hypothetical protein
MTDDPSDGPAALSVRRTRRTVRPFLGGSRLPYYGAIRYGLVSITANEMILEMLVCTRETWTRAPAE